MCGVPPARLHHHYVNSRACPNQPRFWTTVLPFLREKLNRKKEGLKYFRVQSSYEGDMCQIQMVSDLAEVNYQYTMDVGGFLNVDKCLYFDILDGMT